MGNKCCQSQEDVVAYDNVVTGDALTQRENMATWFRSGIHITDVYEIVKTLGEGRMGEVFHVRRLDGGRTHTDKTKKKGEASQHSDTGSDYDMLDESLRRGRDIIRQDSWSNSRHKILLKRRGSNSSSSRSRSPFGKNRKKKGIAKKNEATLASLKVEKNATSDSEVTGGVASFESGGSNARKSPTKNAKRPESILKKSTHATPPRNAQGGANSINNSLHGSNGGDENSTGMTALITGCTGLLYDDDDDDDDDEEVPINIGLLSSQDPTASDTIGEAKFAQSDEPEHSAVKFAQPDEPDDSSVMSEVTMNEDHIKTRIVTLPLIGDVGIEIDDAEQTNKSNNKKWVPRRRVFFRRHYACKTVATDSMKPSEYEELVNEIYMMRKIDHPYIIRLYEVYSLDRKIWLVMDLCKGGELNSRKINEKQVTIVAEQILRGVAYLHRRGICHRDLKMENILYENEKDNSPIRLIDFGLSKTYDSKGKKEKFMGAAYTLSPEVLSKKPYTEKSDIWSIGVIIWVLLAGDYPFIKDFNDLKDENSKKKLEQANHNFGITWRGRGISQCAKEFVTGCLKRDPEHRWSAIEALEYLQDTWIPKLEEIAEEDARLFPPRKKAQVKRRDSIALYTKKFMPPPSTVSEKRRKQKLTLLDEDFIEDITRYAQYSLFQRSILVTIANTMDLTDVGELKDFFLMLDTTFSGSITLLELKTELSKSESVDMNDERIEKIFNTIDYDRSGHIHYREFLAAMLMSQGLLTIDRLEDSFDRIDSQGKGFISHYDLKQYFFGSDSKERLSKKRLDSMIEEGDFNKNGQIDFDEFLQLMSG